MLFFGFICVDGGGGDVKLLVGFPNYNLTFSTFPPFEIDSIYRNLQPGNIALGGGDLKMLNFHLGLGRIN